MGVRFLCPSCHCVLLIARRKAGTEIQCPKCSQRQTVPAESDPLAMAAHPPGEKHAGPATSPADAEGVILNWIEGDESVDEVQVFSAAAHGHGHAPLPPLAPAKMPEKTLPAPPLPPPGPVSPKAVSNESGGVTFQELPPPAPPQSGVPPVVREAFAEEQSSSRMWVVLLLLLVFAAAVAGAFMAGYKLGRQSVTSLTPATSAALPRSGQS